MTKNNAGLIRKAGLACGCSIAALASTPAQAQLVCVPNPLGVLDCGTSDPAGTINLPALAQPVTVLLPDPFASTASVLIDSTGPITLDGDIVVDTLLDNQPALDLTSDANIFAQVTALTTQGDNSAGAVLNAVDDVLLVVDDTVSTLGDFSDGIDVTAGSVNVSLGELRTVGIESDGVELVALSGPATLNADLIETLGSGSTDAILRAAGGIGVNVGVLHTGGDQALGLDLQSDATACAVLGAGSCDIDAVVGNITTDGFGSIGALVVAAGDTDLAVDVLQTGGDEAAGLDLSADPTACVALGVGSCDTAFTVNNLATNGARSPGAIVHAVGDIDGSVGILSTQGDDAIGLDLASDPAACAILGAGACETSFSVGQLTTEGAGAIGALVRAAGPTTANIGVLETAGDGATGLDIAADPQACVVLGLGQCVTSITADRITTLGDLAAGVLVVSPADVVADLGVVETAGLNAPAVSIIADPAACVLLGTGACDATLTGDRITTLGDGSLGVLINTPGQIVADLGLVETDGDNSPGITLITDPAVCLLLGAGSCGVILGGGPDGEGPDVDTGGDNSPGVVVDSPGPIDVDVDDVDTDGDNSPGIDIDGGEGPITVDFGDVTTNGDNSPGVDVDGTGPIDVTGDSVTTGGANSPGVIVTGDDDPVTVTIGPVTTTGPGSNGIDVTTTTGDQTIVAGPVTVTGQGSSGIVGTAIGCADVSITATGPVSSASGIGIDAASACTVTVTTLPGANVSGGVAGIEATSGTGSTITIGGGLSSTGGPALDADGGAATVVVGPAGSITGRIDLTDNADTLTNNGTLNVTQPSDFGAGADLLTNNGTIRVSGVQTLAGLETTANTGLIDLRDGATDDRLTLPGAYSGTGSARLGVDVGAGRASDRLIIGGAATGSTQVLVAGTDGSFVNGAIVVDAGAGTSAGAFVLPATTAGLTDYTLAFNSGANDFLLYGTPSTAAVGAGLLASGAREVFYRGNEAVAAHLDAGSGGSADNPRVSRALWGQAFGMVQDRDAGIDTTAFGQARSYDLGTRQDWFGLQVGLDLMSGVRSALGVTAGYADSRLKLQASPARIDYSAWNLGVYGRADFGAAFIRGLARYERYSADFLVPSAGVRSDIDGDGWGGWLELGARFGGDRFFIEPAASIEYARIDFDDFTAAGTGFAFDEEEGLRGKAGVRFGAVVDSSPSLVTFYGKVQAIHEFGGRDRFTLSNTGGWLAFDAPRTDTYGRATVGFSASMGSGVSGFIEASGDFAGGVSGGGARGGLSIRF